MNKQQARLMPVLSLSRPKCAAVLAGSMLLGLALLCLRPTDAVAGCSAGIPCVSYAIESGVNANKTESRVCDANFMNQIYGRAFVEADREMTMAQATIRKPDSVLEYSCFDRLVSVVAEGPYETFTETDEYEGETIEIGNFFGAGFPYPILSTLNMPIPDHMDYIIENVVLQAADEYLDRNFSHDYLGGSSGEDYSFDNDVDDGSYNCAELDRVWTLAKCDNFGGDQPFYTLYDLTSTDPRVHPSSCGGTNISNDLLNLANNANFAYVDVEDTNTYRNLVSPYSADDGIACQDPIPTGLTVTLYEYETNSTGDVTRTIIGADDATYTFEHKICSNPGCSYNYQSDTCEE